MTGNQKFKQSLFLNGVGGSNLSFHYFLGNLIIVEKLELIGFLKDINKGLLRIIIQNHTFAMSKYIKKVKNVIKST